jgi:probable HAF family extracellular repeat protein
LWVKTWVTLDQRYFGAKAFRLDFFGQVFRMWRMKASSFLFAAFLGFSICAAERRFAIEMIPYRGEYHFYNPAGEIYTGAYPSMIQPVIWDGQTTRPAELFKANDKGDGFINVQTGYDLTLGNEHAIYRARVRVNGVITTIEPFGGESSWAFAINAHGHIVGSAEAPVRNRQPFLFKEGAVVNLNNVIVGPVRFDTPQLIRDDGIIFGSRYIYGGSAAVVRLTPREDGKYDAVELTTLPGSVAFNQNGDVIFKSGLWRNGQIIPLGDLGVPDRVYPKAINSAGQIVGIAMTPNDNNYHGFFWDGQMHDMKDLVELPAEWLPSPVPEDINEFGQIAANVFSGSGHMLLRLTPAPVIKATAAGANGVSITFAAGSTAAVSVQTSTDFKNWTEVKAVAKPGAEGKVEVAAPASAAPQGAQFFRVTRVFTQ